MSWRWSRIGERSAWKKLLSIYGFLAVLGFILCIAYTVAPIPDKEKQSFAWLMFCCGTFFFLQGVAQVLRADDYFSVLMGNKKCKVYVCQIEHKYSPCTYEILLRTKDAEFMVIAAAYDRKIYSGSQNAFIYCVKSDDGAETWMLVNKDSDDAQVLGQRVGYYIFVSPNQHEKDKVVLNILQDDGYTEISADRYTCENILVPQENEIESVYNGKIVQVSTPNEYLIIKNEDKYQVWGIYCNEKIILVAIYYRYHLSFSMKETIQSFF